MAEKSEEKKRLDWKNFVLIIMSTIFTLAILEIMLRIVFATDQKWLYKDYQSTSFIAPNEYWKAWHYPQNETIHSRDCFSATYKTNILGMKDESIDRSKRKIALIGDSYLEGYGESNENTAPYFLQKFLGSQFEVMNFGSSGGLGTVHELSIYDNLVKHLDSEIVILFFLNYNDLVDNINAIDEGYLDAKLNYTYPEVETFDEISDYIQAYEVPESSSNKKGGLIIFDLANRGLRALNTTVSAAINLRFDFRRGIAQVYHPQENDMMKQGWRIVENSLKTFKKETSSHDAKFLVVQIADPFQLDKNWLKVSEKKFGYALDPIYPNKKLKEICERLEIAYLDMYPSVLRYIEEKNLDYPYVYHSCDRHFNADGNKLMADIVYKYLKNNQYLK